MRNVDAGGIEAVVCLSGGLDSAVTLAVTVDALGGEAGRVAALHMTYGQRTEARERRAYEELCDHYGIERRLVVRQPALVDIGHSALTDRGIEVPTDDADAGTADGIPVTYVPFRNGQILAVACAWAESLGAVRVALGAVEEDSSGYPDCRREFFEAFERAVDAGTRPSTRIRIDTPVLDLDKAAIVRRGLELGAPLRLTWSCYQEDEVACGRCESCRLRRRGFERAGAVDPIPYAD